MSTTFPPRQAQAGQRISYADAGGTIRRLEATEVDGRWVIQPQSNGDEAAVRRHRLPVDEELAAKQAAAAPRSRRRQGAEATEAGPTTEADTQDGADAPSQEE
jgi:hypothetical protein